MTVVCSNTLLSRKFIMTHYMCYNESYLTSSVILFKFKDCQEEHIIVIIVYCNYLFYRSIVICKYISCMQLGTIVLRFKWYVIYYCNCLYYYCYKLLLNEFIASLKVVQYTEIITEGLVNLLH